jgi:hypothetical protein
MSRSAAARRRCLTVSGSGSSRGTPHHESSIAAGLLIRSGPRVRANEWLRTDRITLSNCWIGSRAAPDEYEAGASSSSRKPCRHPSRTRQLIRNCSRGDGVKRTEINEPRNFDRLSAPASPRFARPSYAIGENMPPENRPLAQTASRSAVGSVAIASRAGLPESSIGVIGRAPS